MKKLLYNLKNNREGSYAILWVILCFIGIIVISSFVTIMSKAWILNEVQGYMDTAGPPSLRYGVDQTALRVEQFSLDKVAVSNKYIQMVSTMMNNNPKIDSYQIKSVNVSVLDASTWGLDNASSPRPQGVIDSVIKLRIKSDNLFDRMPGVSQRFYNSLSSSYFTVDYNGTVGDNQIELIVRSVSRIVYR